MTQQPRKPTFMLLKHFITTYPARSAVVLASLLISGIVEIIGISALLPLLNVILEKDSTDPNILSHITTRLFDTIGIEPNFSNLLALIVVTISLKAFITYQAMKMVAYAAADITHDLRVNLMQALLSAKWQYYSTLPIGKSANAISTEAESAGHFYTLSGKTIASCIQTSIYTIIAFLVDWRVSLAAVIFGAVGAFLLKFLVRIARDAGGEYTDALNILLGRLTESLSGAKPLKAMGQEHKFTALLKKDTQLINVARKKTATSALSLHAFQEPMLVILISIGLFVMFHYTNYPITELLLIAFLFHRLIGYANQIQASYQKTTTFEAAASSILQATEIAKENAELMTGNHKVELKDKISLNNLTLAYADNVICENLNDHIPANKFTAIFGPSGVGKSTLLDATLGLMAPSGGSVEIDGIPLTKIDIQNWRQSIGYVPQETYLFHDTILQNITLGDKDITEENAKKALEKASAWEFVSEFNDGLHHIVGERGGKLSGGQKQRIALARALARNPKLLILDEATSGLDKESEEAILDALQNMLPDITIIAISHDPKILDLADHVIKM